MRLIIVFLSSILALAMTTNAGVAGASAQWTLMVYLDADNNLESYGVDDFLEMSAIGSTSAVNIIVQMDRISGYDSRYGDWSGCKRFKVTKGMTPIASSALSDIGECNMGAQSTLTDFVNWAQGAYPASKYALVLWNHGGGWRDATASLAGISSTATGDDAFYQLGPGENLAVDPPKDELFDKAVCWDDTNGGDTLYMSEVKQALNIFNQDIALIGFDACLMGMIEVAVQFIGTGAQVMVGSEELIPGTGWPYQTILSDLAATPSMDAATLGTRIVERYYESYYNDNTMTAVRMDKVAALRDSINGLAQTMLGSVQNKSAVAASARAVNTALTSALIANRHGAGWPGARSLAIYFPTGGPVSTYSSTYIDFPGSTQWDEFLKAYPASFLNSWIHPVRVESQCFDLYENIDIGDFCDRLISASGVTTPVQPFSGYEVSQPAYAFEDISATGTNLNLSDDSCSQLTSVGFPFKFYGVDKSTIYVCSNGVISFKLINPGYSNNPIPSTNPNGADEFLAPYWDDLVPVSSTVNNVFFSVVGAAPNRRLIIQWNAVRIYYTSGDVRFQAILYENGDVRYNYADVDVGLSSDGYGLGATVGMQKNSLSGMQYSYNQRVLNAGLSILYRPLKQSRRLLLSCVLLMSMGGRNPMAP